MIENDENIALENYLNISHPEIVKSINKEKYILDYDNFDLFYEIRYEDEVAGFIAIENDDFNQRWIINECYILPDLRGNNLFYKNYVDIINSTEKRVFIRKPNKNLINALLGNGLAFKMQNDIVISYVDFVCDLKDAFKNSKIKHHYKKVKDENLTVIANLFDLNLSGVLFFDDNHAFSKFYDVLCICEARKYDLKKYSIRKKLKKIQPKYLDETYEIIFDSLKDSFDYFKNLDENLSNSNKTRNKFLNENPMFKNKLEDIHPNSDFIFHCPFCEEITQKSAIHCYTCGLNLEKTLIRNENKDNFAAVEDYLQDSIESDFENSIQKDFDEMRNIFDSDDEFKDAFSKIIEATNEMALISKELRNEPPEYLNIIDYDYLNLDRSKYDSEEEKDLNIEKSMYALVKYTNEHPTPWNAEYHLKSVDGNTFDLVIEKEYLKKVMPDEFPVLFKDCTVEELIRESELYHDPDTTKEDMINYFMEWCDWSYVVSEKGFEYLKSSPFLNFFTNNLIDFNIYEFKLYADKYGNELTIEEIGDKYVNAKLKKALSNNERDLYLNYVDYYFNLNLSKNDYEAASLYLIERIIYEINRWHLKEYHVSFDEPFSLTTDYLLFKIAKLNPDLDLEKLYNEAYNSLKIEEIKFNYAENYEIVKSLMNGESIFDIGGDMLEKAKEQGKFKSLLK